MVATLTQTVLAKRLTKFGKYEQNNDYWHSNWIVLTKSFSGMALYSDSLKRSINYRFLTQVKYGCTCTRYRSWLKNNVYTA